MNNNDYIKNILFFSGGTALREIASEFSTEKHLKMINIITAFDSGGSTAIIRKHFDVIGIGDIRNRIISLIIKKQDKSVVNFLRYRFSSGKEQKELKEEFNALLDKNHNLFLSLPSQYQNFFWENLNTFNKFKPENFNLKNGSLGNFIILGNYLRTQNIYLTIDYFRKILNIKDEILPVCDIPVDLKARLSNNKEISKQHMITNFQDEKSKIVKISPTKKVTAPKAVIKAIKKADLIVYPIGSFYTSVLSNFLVEGISQAIKNNTCKKLYIPNTYYDSELSNRSLSFQINEIKKYLKDETNSVLTHVILDKNHNYPFETDFENIDKKIKTIKTDIIKNNSCRLDPKKVINLLQSFKNTNK